MKGGKNRQAEKRKKILIFFALCVVSVSVIILTVVLVTMLKSDNERPPAVKIIRVFTNLGYNGNTGPEEAKEYRRTALENEVDVIDGMQLWSVPLTGVWYFEVYGASGGDGAYAGHAKVLKGGPGAKLTGELFLKKGEVLKILVGHQGIRDHVTQFRTGSGGGGTFIVSQDDQPIMIAGGGGGGGVPQLGRYTAGGPGNGIFRGNRGKGGTLFDPQRNITVRKLRKGHECQAGAGGGFHSDGAGYLKGWGGRAFVHGGIGGFVKKRKFTSIMDFTGDDGYDKGGSNGGFGGGGAAGLLPGGGGGFIGGNVRGAYLYDVGYKKAEGGSSYNKARSPSTIPGVHHKHGRVYAKFLGETIVARNKTDPRIPKTREEWYKD